MSLEEESLDSFSQLSWSLGILRIIFFGLLENIFLNIGFLHEIMNADVKIYIHPTKENKDKAL